MKFFRKHKKAVSPVIAVMLLVAVAVAAVGAYFIWFRSFQTQTQKSVQETSSGALGGGLQIISMTDDGKNYYIVLKNTTGSRIDLRQQGTNLAIAANPGGTLSISSPTPGSPDGNVTIQSQATITITAAPSATPSWNITRGTTRTFTFNALVAPGTPDSRSEVLVHTYTDS